MTGTIKRVLSLLLALSMSLGMAVTAAASDGGPLQPEGEPDGQTVAKVGDAYYTSLDTAVAAAAAIDGGAVELVCEEYTLTDTVRIDAVKRELTIDLKGNTIHNAATNTSGGAYIGFRIDAPSGTVTFQNGTIDCVSPNAYGAIYVLQSPDASGTAGVVLKNMKVLNQQAGPAIILASATADGTVLTVDKDSTVSNKSDKTKISTDQAAISNFGKAAIHVSGAVRHEGTFAAINGAWSEDGGFTTDINVEPGAVVSQTQVENEPQGAGILMMSNGTVTVSGSVSGSSGIDVTLGGVIIKEGAVINGVGPYHENHTSSGANPGGGLTGGGKVYEDGSAVFIDPSGKMSVTIEGGTLTSKEGHAVSARDTDNAGKLTLAITGGTLSGAGEKAAVEVNGLREFISGGTFSTVVDSAYLKGNDVYVRKNAGGAFTYGALDELLEAAGDAAYTSDSFDKSGALIKKAVKIRFDFNDGTAQEPKDYPAAVDAAVDAVVKLPAGITRSGYTFAGWRSSEAKDETLYKDTYKVPDPDAQAPEITLTAQWTKEEDPPSGATYTIAIASGIANGTVTADKTTAAAGETVKLTVTPDRGYQLKELTAAPSTVVITNNAFTMPAGNVTISAVFEPAPLTGTVAVSGMPRSGETLTVSVTGSNNTGTFSYQWSADVTAIAGATGETYVLTDNEVGKRITCTVKSDIQTGSVTSAETAPVAAKGSELTAYKVTFDMGGHGAAPAAQTVYAGGKAAKPADPTASGYTFGGWFKDSAKTTVFDFAAEIITADTVIYAKWTENQSSEPGATYTITIASGIANGTVTADKATAAAGETVTLTAAPNSGYYLSAISTTPALTLSGSGNTRTFTMPADNVTVSATFSPGSSAPALTGYVFIDGEPWVGETLTAVVRNSNYTGTLYYQWYADNFYIYGGTSRYLDLTRSEVGKIIRCVVTSSDQTGSISGRLWDTVEYYNGRYPSSGGSSNNGSTGTNQSGQSGNTGNTGTGDDLTVETPLFTTVTNADGTKSTTINQPDGSSGLVTLTSYGTVSSASITFSSTAFTNALRTGSALTVPASVQASRSADSAVPVRIILPQAAGAVKVKIPVSQMTAGTVAVMENYFGPDTIVRSSVSESDGVRFELTGSAVVKVVDNSRSFQDVFDGAWYADAVKWASSREVMNGVSPQMFDPQGAMNRAMMAQMLYNFDGTDHAGAVSQFSDVSSGDWYAASVGWAAKNGIARSYGDRFGAEDALTREDMAVMLYNYARMKGYNPYASGSLSAFSDNGAVSDWARPAMQWAVGARLINGTQNGTRAVVLDPQGTVTRAQLATIMQRFNNLY